MQIYAVGDIHGRAGELDKALDWIASDRRRTGARTAPVVFVGDLVDRGPDARGVIDRLSAGVDAGEPWIVIKGNHDRMFAGFLDDPGYVDPKLRPDLDWLDPALGGAATLASYGVIDAEGRPRRDVHEEAAAAVPERHRAFLAGLVLWHDAEEVVFVHAGIRPGVPLSRQVEDDLVWIRDGFLDSDADHGPLVVHGHTVVDEVTHYGNRLAIDTGAGHGGPLIPVVIEGAKVWALAQRGRKSVEPPG